MRTEKDGLLKAIKSLDGMRDELETKIKILVEEHSKIKILEEEHSKIKILEEEHSKQEKQVKALKGKLSLAKDKAEPVQSATSKNGAQASGSECTDFFTAGKKGIRNAVKRNNTKLNRLKEENKKLKLASGSWKEELDKQEIAEEPKATKKKRRKKNIKGK